MVVFPNIPLCEFASDDARKEGYTQKYDIDSWKCIPYLCRCFNEVLVTLYYVNVHRLIDIREAPVAPL